jgi:hypothetical protein
MSATERKLEIARMSRKELNAHAFLCEREQLQYEELIKYQKGLLESQAKEIEKWKREALQQYPTPDAYNAACKALHKHRDIAEIAVKALERIDSIKETLPDRFENYDIERSLDKAEKLANNALAEINRLSGGENISTPDGTSR